MYRKLLTVVFSPMFILGFGIEAARAVAVLAAHAGGTLDPETKVL